MQRVALHTLGCKLNFAESSAIGRQFVERGFRVVDPDDEADVVVLNTCSVTARAEVECRQLIRRALRRTPSAFILVTGCYAQLRPEEIAALDGVDAVLGAQEKFRIFDHIGAFVKRPVPQTFVSCIDEAPAFGEAMAAEIGGRTRAFLKIQDGCDFPCAFCTIPRARGASRSRPPEAVVADARALVERGFREIVLTGVNVGDYDGGLPGLLALLDRIDGIGRIRISSIEPNLLTRALVDQVLDSAHCCNHFHVPLQSGSDAVLRRMRRRYDTRRYREIVDYIRTSDPDAGIGADVIAGFPGETDELFTETTSFIAGLPLTYLHAFTYSDRPGTPSASFDGSVGPKTRFARTRVLRMLGARKRAGFLERFIGRTLPVLIESARPEGGATGLAPNYIRVACPGAGAGATNTIVDALIMDAGGDSCIAAAENPPAAERSGAAAHAGRRGRIHAQTAVS